MNSVHFIMIGVAIALGLIVVVCGQKAVRDGKAKP
jgi:nitrogen fixation-related uncharacterized protein